MRLQVGSAPELCLKASSGAPTSPALTPTGLQKHISVRLQQVSGCGAGLSSDVPEVSCQGGSRRPRCPNLVLWPRLDHLDFDTADLAGDRGDVARSDHCRTSDLINSVFVARRHERNGCRNSTVLAGHERSPRIVREHHHATVLNHASGLVHESVCIPLVPERRPSDPALPQVCLRRSVPYRNRGHIVVSVHE